MIKQLMKVITLSQAVLLFGILMSTVTVSAESTRADILKATNKKENGAYVREKFVSLMGKTFDTTGEESNKKKVIVIGDSHAQDFINMAFEGAHLDNYQVKTRHIPTQCQVVLSDGYEKYIEQKSKEICNKSDSVKAALGQIKQADVVILVANWKEWSAKEMPATIKNLHLIDDQKVYVIGRKNFGKIKLRKLMRKSKKKLLAIQNPVDGRQESIVSIMEKVIPKDSYVDFQNTVCGSKDKCAIFTPDAKLVTFDGGHLTKHGAKYLGGILFSKTILSEL